MRSNIGILGTTCTSALALALAAFPLPALAQNAGASGAAQQDSADVDQNAIVVTARRVEERLQDVPLSVTVLTAEDLKRQALDDLGDIADKTVGFSFESLSPAIVQPAIRGQTNLRVDSPVQNVAFYIDGIYLQRGYLVDQSLLELQRVEVIKGPQSALYGRNAFAGAVNMVTRTPDLETPSLKFSSTVGTDERFDARASFSYPIIPGRLALFGSAAHSEFDGTWKNNHPLADDPAANTKDNLGGYNKEAYQVRLVAKPFDALTLDALYIRTERDAEASPTYITGTRGLTSSFNSLNCSPVANNPANPATLQNRLSCGALSPNVQLFPGETRLPGLNVDPRSFGLRGPTDVVSAKARLEMGEMFEAVYQYGYTKARIRGRGSVSRDPLLPFVFFGTNFGALFDSSGSDSRFKGESHELRLNYTGGDTLRGLLGFNYSNTDDINSNANEVAPIGATLVQPNDATFFFPIGAGLPFPSGFFQRSTFLQRKEKVYSVFGFVGIDLSEQLEVAIEGRYTWEEQRATDLLTRDPANPAIQNNTPPMFARDNEYFTPRGSITYKMTPDNNIYASVARGVKQGGLNGNTPFTGQRSFENETNWTYEIGTKNSFMDGRLTLNLAAYHTNWKNLQGSVVRLQASGAPPASFIAIVPSTVGNIGDVKVYGAEIELGYRLTPELRLNAAASYNRSRYTDNSFSQRFGASGNCDGVVCSTITVPGQPTMVLAIGGNQLERVPEFEALGGLSYSTELSNGWEFFARTDATYQTKSFTDESNLAFAPSRFLVNASTGVTIGQLGFQLWAKNLLDRKYVSNAFVLIGTGGGFSASVNPTLGDQRTVGLTTTLTF